MIVNSPSEFASPLGQSGLLYLCAILFLAGYFSLDLGTSHILMPFKKDIADIYKHQIAVSYRHTFPRWIGRKFTVDVGNKVS